MIYNPEQYDEVLDRIKRKIAGKGIELNDVASPEYIENFERKCSIQLPEAYKRFITEVGNGCIMIDGFPLEPIENIELSDLSRPFIFDKEWIWENDVNTNINTGNLIDFVNDGNIGLIDIGCGQTFNLIVTGKCRGEVWAFSDVGIQPCCERQDFLGWFELWLDNQDKTDYFKDYVYCGKR